MNFFNWRAGLGGFALGLQMSGHQPVGLQDYQACMRIVLAEGFPSLQILSYQLPEQADLLVTSFYHRNTKEEDRYEFLDCLAETGAATFIIEDDPLFLGEGGGRNYAAYLLEISRRGFFAGWRVLDTACFGAGVSSNRLYLVGCTASTPVGRIIFETGGGQGTIALRDSASEHLEEGATPKLFARDRGDEFVETENIPAYPVSAPDALLVSPFGTVRRLLVEEYEHLYGFPTDWTKLADFTEYTRRRLLQYTTPVAVGLWFGTRLRELEGN